MYTPTPRATIEAQIISKYEAELGTSVPILRRAFVRITAIAFSGVIWLMHHLVAWAMKQIFIQLMDADYLEYFGDWYGLPRKSASVAIITADVSGTNGTELRAGVLALYGSLVFTIRSTKTIAGGVAEIELEALTAGVSGNLETGTVLALPAPLVGVDSIVVTGILVPGVEKEDVEDWRSRLKARMQTAPQGGAFGDYIRWACEVAGIVAAHVKRSGTDVFVYPLTAKTGASRIPAAGKLAETQDYLQDPVRRPLCATVYAYAATERTVAATITGLTPNDEDTKAGIVADFNKYVYAAYPKQYSDEANPTDVISAGGVWAILIARGAIATAVSLSVSGIGSGVPSYTLPIGEIASPGVVSWG